MKKRKNTKDFLQIRLKELNTCINTNHKRALEILAEMKKAVENNPPSMEKLNILTMHLSVLTQSSNDPQKILADVDEILEFINDYDLPDDRLHNAFFTVAVALIKILDYSDAFKYFELAEKSASQANNNAMRLSCYINLAFLKMKALDKTQANLYLAKARTLLKNNNLNPQHKDFFDLFYAELNDLEHTVPERLINAHAEMLIEQLDFKNALQSLKEQLDNTDPNDSDDHLTKQNHDLLKITYASALCYACKHDEAFNMLKNIESNYDNPPNSERSANFATALALAAFDANLPELGHKKLKSALDFYLSINDFPNILSTNLNLLLRYIAEDDDENYTKTFHDLEIATKNYNLKILEAPLYAAKALHLMRNGQNNDALKEVEKAIQSAPRRIPKNDIYFHLLKSQIRLNLDPPQKPAFLTQYNPQDFINKLNISALIAYHALEADFLAKNDDPDSAIQALNKLKPHITTLKNPQETLNLITLEADLKLSIYTKTPSASAATDLNQIISSLSPHLETATANNFPAYQFAIFVLTAQAYKLLNDNDSATFRLRQAKEISKKLSPSRLNTLKNRYPYID